MLCLRSFLWIQRSKKNSTEGSNGYSSRVKSTQNLSRSTSLEMNGYFQRAIHILNLRLQSFLLPQRAEISTQCTLKAFLSPQRPNVTRWLNYLPQRAEVLTHQSIIAIFSFASTGKCNSMVELFASTGRDFDSSIKFNAPTCEEYCE